MVNVPITRDVSLKIDWKEFSKNLLDAGAQGLLTFVGVDGVSGGISALVAALGSIKPEAEPGQKIWSLALLCFAWTLDELKADGKTEVQGLRLALQEAIAEARNRIDRGLEVCPATFLERPVTLPLYRFLRDNVVSKKHLFRAAIKETDEVLRARFDSAFNRSMFEILSKRPELYNSIASIFNLGGIYASDFELNWEAYRQRLIFDFEVKPIFGQESSRVSLGQLYVPLRGYWSNTDEEDNKSDRNRSITTTHTIGQIDDLLDAWLSSTNEEDGLRLIGGGPGSGKSTTLRAFARRMADRIDYRTLFIPLQHIDLQENLRDAINNYFTEQSNSAFVYPPLARIAVEDGPPLVLIFDGLDELARPGEAANEVVNLFATKLVQLVSALRGDAGKPIKAVVSGRMPSFQAARKYLSAPQNCSIEVYGYSPLLNVDVGTDPLWSVDQRPTWWKRYAELMSVAETLPPAFSSTQLAGITHEPLLCYLLVLSGFATENWQQAAENPNRIYRTLIDSVWERGWGEGQRKRQGPGKSLSKVNFNHLMQTIALAAWHGGDTRVATEGNFAHAVKVMGVEDAWDIFTADNGTDVTNLAMNFYMKASESKQRGFEFTHKSFGDYLAARAILDFAEQLPIWINRNIEHAMADWLAATGTGTLTHEILTFLRDEVRLRIAASNEKGTSSINDTINNKKAFERLASSALADGFPAHATSLPWRIAETRQSNAEVMAWAVLNSFSLGLASVGRTERFVVVDWPQGGDAFHQLLRRCGKLRSAGNPFLRCFSYIVAPRTDFFGLSLFNIDLHGAKLAEASFAGCHLIGADLGEADLTNCDFQRAMLDGADLTGATLTSATLFDTRLTNARLEGADLKDARVTIQTLLYYDGQDLVRRGVDLDYLASDSHPDGGPRELSVMRKTVHLVERLRKAKLNS